MVCMGIRPRSWRSEECVWRWFQDGECDICKYLWSRWVGLISPTCDTDVLFSLFLQSYGSFQWARSCRGMFLFLLLSFLCLCLLPCLWFQQEHTSFPNYPIHLYYASSLTCFLAGFNHAVDYGSPSAAWTESWIYSYSLCLTIVTYGFLYLQNLHTRNLPALITEI